MDASLAAVCAVIDTNILLHYQWPEDWDSRLEGETVSLVFVPLVFRELEKRQYQDSSERMRDRARRVLRRLSDLFDSGTEAQLRNGIVAVAVAAEPALNFADHSLSREVADDYLIAHLVELRTAGRNVALLSADGPAAFKAKLRGFRVIRPQDSWLLPVEPSKDERELQQLRAEKTAQPKLSLTIAGAKKIDSISYCCQLLNQWTSMDKSEMLAQLTRQLRGIPAGGKRTASEEWLLRENDAKIKNWTRYLDDLDRYRQQLVLELPFAVWNGGMRSAENVHVVISAKVKATLTDEPPEVPNQDSERSAEDQILHRIDRFETPQIKDLRLESIFSQSGSHSAEMSITGARQVYTTDLPTLYLLFSEEHDLDSFNFEWEIRAANIGAPVRGRLNVLVTKIAARPVPWTEKKDLPTAFTPEPLS
jgi:hypothetical protein